MVLNCKNEIEKISSQPWTKKSNCPREMKIVLSFKYLTDEKEYNYQQLTQSSQYKKFTNAFFTKLKTLSNLTWNTMNSSCHRNNGIEYLPKEQIDSKIFSNYGKYINDDYKIAIIRFGDEGRIFLKRGSECNRIANVLGFDINMKAYKHE